jgi:alpha-glucan,water dikinase
LLFKLVKNLFRYAVEHHMDTLCELAQTPADVIGSYAGCDKAYLQNFGEEVVRGHSMFAVSKMHADVQRAIRTAAGRSAWMVVSHGAPELNLYAGTVTVANLADIQG